MSNSEFYRKIFLFLSSFTCSQVLQMCSQNTHAMYLHKHQKMTMNNILTSGGLNTISFFNYLYFQKIRLLINKIQQQISNPLSVLNCFLYCDRSINIVTSFSQINILFLNFVPQLIKKTYRVGHNVILKICMHDRSAGTYFFNGKTVRLFVLFVTCVII